ncbi:tRNA 2-selenouridine(34) synthase MnmH [Virgibacillus kekensis]|uniref:tRNA 2-selenouridine(34) synthase MnmH n=1 Tax=Virgibacillus kekensis TaxID=202261 RepID=A0ABV9DL94_9BACI
MFRDISFPEVLEKQEKENHTLIDVRSPKEYEEATIPGSVNIPVFTDEERAEVGTLYKQVGKKAAKQRGLEIMSAKLPEFITRFQEIDTPKTVFCWRGGMRSKTAATLVDLMGADVNRLTGGYRSYRQWVVSFLEKEDFKPELLVLNGNTGSGKTILLKRLADEGYPVMDLEGMANHRGSIFGQIGLNPSNQKKFDSLLVDNLLRFQESRFVFVEGESRRIGRITIPEFLYRKKEQGIQLFIELPVEERINNILEDYQPWNSPKRFMEAFQLIRRKIHTPIAKEIESALTEGHYRNAVKLLLEYYYDPRYEHAADQYPEERKVHLQANTMDEAYQLVVDWCNSRKLTSLT